MYSRPFLAAVLGLIMGACVGGTMRTHKQRNVDGMSRVHGRGKRILLLAVVLSGVALGFWLWPVSPRIGGGMPRLETDRTEIDLGDVPFERWVTATFTLRNVGDGTLTIGRTGPVRATEGC